MSENLPRWQRVGTFTLEQRARFTALALKRNLAYVRWREEHPYGESNVASVGVQLAATLLLWLATTPLERVMSELDRASLTPKRRKQWEGLDFQPDDPGGLRANLPRWREAVALGQVEVLLSGDGWRVLGLRAWVLETGGGSPVWEMTLDRERLEQIVDTLSSTLPYWSMQFTPPEPAPATEARRSGRGRKGRKAKLVEPAD